jgi:site-specific DNA recombinase
MTTIIYSRVSTKSREDGDDQAESAARQVELCRLHASIMGWTDVVVLTDKASGFKSTRPGYQDLLARCRAGQVERVVVYNLSRLSRNVRDTLDFVEEFVRGGKVQLVSLRESIDTSTPMGLAFLGFMAIFNQLYRDQISHDTKRAIAHKKSKGERVGGHVPFGYRDEGGKLVPDPGEQDALAFMRIRREAGADLARIAEELELMGVPTKLGKKAWQPKTIARLLAS